jgi:hypothetical protein
MLLLRVSTLPGHMYVELLILLHAVAFSSVVILTWFRCVCSGTMVGSQRATKHLHHFLKTSPSNLFIHMIQMS